MSCIVMFYATELDSDIQYNSNHISSCRFVFFIQILQKHIYMQHKSKLKALEVS